MTFLEFIPLLNLVWVVGAFLINRTIVKLDQKFDKMEAAIEEINLKLASSNLETIPERVEALQQRKAEMSVEMQALWRALESISSTAKERSPKDRIS